VSARRRLACLIVSTALLGCGGRGPTPSAGTSVRPSAAEAPPSRAMDDSEGPVLIGDPIELEDLSGRIVFDDFEDVFVMDVDGSNVIAVADDPAGSEFDGDLSPDGNWVVYRDSTRGINKDDEIFIVGVDGSGGRNLTNDPANDWGPAWSPDGTTIAFNSDRDGGALRGYLVDADGSNLRRLDVDTWFEYPSFSPDGTQITFEGYAGSDYEVYVADVASGAVRQLTDSPGRDGWPVWSPDGSTIAFSSVRDDCALAQPGGECWRDAEDEHSDIWLMDADGRNQRRLTPEISQFVDWSRDGEYLVVSGHALFVVRRDGSGRLELRADGIDRPLGGIPDWG
jgi:Tol biopolymer transport system component